MTNTGHRAYPLVARVDPARQFVVGQNLRWQIPTGARDGAVHERPRCGELFRATGAASDAPRVFGGTGAGLSPEVSARGNGAFYTAPVEDSRSVLRKIGHTAKDIDLVIPHQANPRIIEAVARRLEISRERTFTNLDRNGNMSSASIPVAIAEAADWFASGQEVESSCRHSAADSHGRRTSFAWVSARRRWAHVTSDCQGVTRRASSSSAA